MCGQGLHMQKFYYMYFRLFTIEVCFFKGDSKVKWTSETNVKISLRKIALPDQCATLDSSNLALLFEDNIYHITNIAEIHPFVCEHTTITVR